ncbi:MAG TPA: ATP-binding protein [Longimicrobiaceae bacterium]
MSETSSEALGSEAPPTGSPELAVVLGVLDQLPAAVALYEGPDHVFTLTNAAYRRIIGHRDPVGKPIREVLPELAAQGFVALLDGVLRTGEPVSGQGQRADWDDNGDGVPEEHYVDFAYTPLPGPGGTPRGVVAQVVDVTERVRAERERAFLARASDVLASSLDYDATLAAVTRLAVDGIADWCAVDELTPDGAIRRIAVAHPDPDRVALAHLLHEKYPPDPDDPQGLPAVLRTGEPLYVEEVTDDMLVAGARDEEHLRLARVLGLRSVIIVPLAARGTVLGALTLVSAESGRRYGPGELRLAQELASRAAVAIDNARLYRDSEETLVRLEEQASELEAQAGEMEEMQAELEIANDELLRANHDLALRAVEAERAADRSHRLQALAAALNEATTPEEVARACVDHGREALGADVGSLATLTADGAGFEIVYTSYPEGLAEKWRRFPVTPGRPLSDAVLGRAPVLLGTREEGAERYAGTLVDMDAAGVVAHAAVPVVSGGRALGGLSFGFRSERRFEPGDRTLLAILGEQAAQAMERARLFEAERRARTEAESANRAKTEFLSAMSHELRTPLNAIAGYVDLMEMGIRGPVTDLQRSDLERIRRAQAVLLGLITDILNFARIEAGRIEYRVEEVPLRPLLEDLETLVDPQLRARELDYRCTPCGDDLRAVGDPERVRQILVNLLSNAVKFTDPGGRVSVDAAAEGDRAVVRVADTGRGIPPDKLDAVFDPFVQVDRHATRESQQGVGLGLAISRELARAMGGDLVVESTPGEGSVFSLLLPLAAG